MPAKGSADVTVTMDGRVVDGAGQYGRYAGALTAKDSTGTTLGSSRISAVLEPIRHDLTIKVIPPAGATDIRYGNALIVPMDEDKLNLYEDPVVAPGGETIKARVFAGTVAAALTVMWRDAAGELQQALPMAPQVQVTGATTVELDLRKAKPVRVNAAEPTETYRAVFKLQRTSVDGNWGLSAGMASDYGPGEPNWWVLPTSEVSVGTLSFNSQHVLVPPSVTMKVTGNGASFHLDARYAKPDTSIQGGTQQWTENGRKLNRFVRLTIPRLPTNGKKPVVYAAPARPRSSPRSTRRVRWYWCGQPTSARRPATSPHSVSEWRRLPRRVRSGCWWPAGPIGSPWSRTGPGSTTARTVRTAARRSSRTQRCRSCPYPRPRLPR